VQATLRFVQLKIALIVVAYLFPLNAFAACGDKGGPGYRDANGKCVGWAALARSCGNPPTLRCTPERAQPEAPVAAQHGSQIRQLMDAAHKRARGAEK